MTVSSDTAQHESAVAAPLQEHQEPQSQRMGARRWWILAVLCASQFMAALDFSIVSVALPTIGEELGFELSSLQWVITAFALPSGGLLLLFARAGDLYGRRKWFLAGLALFTVTSLAGGLAQDPALLLAARVGQGLATAMLVPSGLALLTTSFPEGPLRNKALGINGALLSLGFTAGVILGGVITESLDWRWTMFINVPFGIVAIALTLLLVAESRNSGKDSLDLPGAVSVSAGLLAVIYGVTEAEKSGWTGPVVLLSLAVGVALLVAFVVIETRSASPLVPVHVLKRRSVGWGNFAGLVTFSMITSVVFLMTMYMHQVMDFNPLQIGLCFASLGGAMIVAGPLVPHLVRSWGPGTTLGVGLTVQATGTAVLLLLGADGDLGVLLVGTGIAGWGHMMAVVSYTIAATNGLSNALQGAASGLATTAQLVGLTLGTPVIGAIATGRIATVKGSVGAKEATVAGVHLGVIVVVAFLAVGVVTSLAFLRPQPDTAAKSS
ncbi:MFS transporter [Streptomyces sp. B-S-A8]|uniref:MFS transporter n=1 Tax=Streptomyces solicavernae TaxID=3043614 RepID=A0ABT6RZV1_9ACTN|nr:MFS transporter [Streptomyces sp. B-S-A8]MDI3389972.1 MFS transporter [Streptomyces sp. B-S-A8]